jgi:hypothetical protein
VTTIGVPVKASSQSLLRAHLWHGIEGLAFLVITLGGIAVVEWREARRRRPVAGGGPAASAPSTTFVTGVRTWLVALVAACSVVAAGIHFRVMPEHFHEAWLYGTFFLCCALAQLGYAALVVWRPSRALLVVGAVANAVVVGLWLTTRLHGIPLGPAAGETEPFGLLDTAASSAEAFLVVVALAAASPWAARRPSPVVDQPVPAYDVPRQPGPRVDARR